MKNVIVVSFSVLFVAVACFLYFQAEDNKSSWKMMRQAIKTGDHARMEHLLAHNPKLANLRGPDEIYPRSVPSFTPLHLAARFGDKKMVALLLFKGAYPNSRGTRFNPKCGPIDNITPLHEAVERLYGSNADGLYDPVVNSCKEVVELLLAYGAEVNIQNGRGETPLHMAVCVGEDKQTKVVVGLLLASNADVNIKDIFGCTPLFGAQEDVAKLLLAYKADVNARDNYGRTPLHESFDQRVAKLLLANHADVNARDKFGCTPLHRAGQKLIAEVLLANKAEVNAKNLHGATPLHEMVRRAHEVNTQFTDTEELLLTAGADVNARDNKGRTPLDYAESAPQDFGTAKFLRAHGGKTGKELDDVKAK